MKYIVNPVNVENDFIWQVTEVPTDQVIREFFFEDDALEYANFLANGGAFDGWTPSFILRQTQISDDINQRFSTLFDGATKPLI